jgi:anti-sigma factor RsiW
MSSRISREELSAFIDGELPPARAAEIAAALNANPELAAEAALFRQDKDWLAAAYAPVAQAPLPRAWIDRIEAAVEPSAAVLPFRPRVSFWHWAMAASVALVLGASLVWRQVQKPADSILADAEAARSGQMVAAASLEGTALPPDETQVALLKRATGLPVRAPDLRRLGWRLTALRMFSGAAELRYGDAEGRTLTVYVRKSLGTPRSDLLRHGRLRICIDQDDTVSAVIIGDISAGQMIRAAGLAYADLDL